MLGISKDLMGYLALSYTNRPRERTGGGILPNMNIRHVLLFDAAGLSDPGRVAQSGGELWLSSTKYGIELIYVSLTAV